MIKKLLIPLAALTALMLSACGRSADEAAISPSPAVSATPAVTATASAAPTSSAAAASESPKEKSDNGTTADSEDAAESGDTGSTEGDVPEKRVSNNETEPDEISIINGTSIELYGIYITSNPDGNPGENIINGSTLGEGEEIALAYANIEDSGSLCIIVEDENGRQYRASGFELTNGAVVELRLNGASLEAVVQ